MTPMQTYSSSFVQNDTELGKEQTSVKEQITVKIEPVTVKEEHELEHETEPYEEITIKVEEATDQNNEQKYTIKQENYQEQTYEVPLVQKCDYDSSLVVNYQNEHEVSNLEHIISCIGQNVGKKDQNLPVQSSEQRMEKQQQIRQKQLIKLEQESAIDNNAKKIDDCIPSIAKQPNDSHNTPASTSNAAPAPASYPCETCQKLFNTKKLLSQHKRTHSVTQVFPCQNCSKTYKKYTGLKIHIMRAHTGEKPFECDYCGYSTHTRLSIKAHIRIHTGETPYKCKNCKESFRTIGSLNTHNRKLHGGPRRNLNEIPRTCHICNKVIYYKSTFEKHMNKHLGKGPTCDICKKTFSTKGALRIHIKGHLGTPQYSCTMCDKSFYTKSHLKCHIRVHEDKKLHKCHICDWSFNQKYHLNAHILLHERPNAKNFKCDLCHKSFVIKNYLMKHITAVHKKPITKPSYKKRKQWK